MQISLDNSGSTHPNRKRRRRRAKRKNTQRQSQKSDETPQSAEDHIQPLKESEKESGDNPPSTSVCVSNEEITEGSVKEGTGSPESQKRKRKRKKKRKGKKDTSHNEDDSGISNSNATDYTGPYGELYMSTDNLFTKLSDELPTINKAIQSFDSSKGKEIDHLTWHLEIVQKSVSQNCIIIIINY
ncbi:unnamed protein product [Hymenolepis diminuta]|uniref:Protein FAM133-like n=1 Tax=Hymenolepis diminuta TaxID=6216 RepID=A0A0R3SR04_HYMDI|nr:unnamed protein product [Hymenolepis diminuta]